MFVGMLGWWGKDGLFPRLCFGDPFDLERGKRSRHFGFIKSWRVMSYLLPAECQVPTEECGFKSERIAAVF